MDKIRTFLFGLLIGAAGALAICVIFFVLAITCGNVGDSVQFGVYTVVAAACTVGAYKLYERVW